MSHERRLDFLERCVSELDGGVKCRTCGLPRDRRSRGIQLVRRVVSVPDDFPPISTCTDCGNRVNGHGRYAAHYERSILEEREDEDLPSS